MRAVDVYDEALRLAKSGWPLVCIIDELADLMMQAAKEVEESIAADREANGQKWLGRKECLKINPFDAPTTKWTPFTLNPKVSSKHEEARKAWILRLKRFRTHYREAKREFRAGNREVPFPPGTYAMRVFWAVALDPQL